ncbi:MAG: ribbon-helix-helix protein, CopG family [Acidimicrobiaceae bacterium]|nr:ribbon-helix-helix protein, CopG family [Acidimicrobiaceae bacterium]MXZ97431.1 ribbon-helix-helix protein, CopG family [Acidimicrobiaceae bacterium]MYE76577.1 ribbon-helix-helix protein, CopG family [Acidimicrobiaceae bacterium]MYE98451.1 ribbon-helix-helix protein, CopG family [Acidimicrobiaceae bacterium]MYH44484.1 ribbon-helix-helix protein, CopG family [Acidimicrobiaceae bacterium]
MTDILIRKVPDDLVAAIEANATRAGLSRAEYLRRALERERRVSADDATVESLERFCKGVADLRDPDVMRAAWS